MDYKAAMFDFDGTITKKGHFAPDKDMTDALFRLSQEMPIGFCTGRQLESFVSHGLDELLINIDKNNHEAFLKNLFLFGENGAIGYFFSTQSNNFEEFYRVDWPSSFIDEDELRNILDEAVKGVGSVYYNAHRVVVVIRTRLHYQEHKDVEEVYALSDQLYKITLDTLRSITPDFEKYVHVGNSGIGVVVCPADGDKDTGIQKFAEFLREKRGENIGEKAREIVVVGDRPELSGNDHYFLNGQYGTPYTVGSLIKNAKYPMPVLDNKGHRLLHAQGTIHLINSILA
ncbi:MAG: hypothetical protein O3B47_05190 [bacterium]|nr:hypothetical protein [bacterium]